MKKNLRIFKSIGAGIVRPFHIPLLLLLPIGITNFILLHYYEHEGIYLGGNGIIESLSPIKQVPPSANDMAMILLPLLLAMLLFGSFLTTELQQRCRYTIPRVGSISKWYFNIAGVILVFSLIYSIVYTMIALGISKIYDTDLAASSWYIYDMLGLGDIVVYGFSLFIRLSLILFLQIVIILIGNIPLSFTLPFLVLIISLYFPGISYFLPFGGTFIPRLVNQGHNIYLWLFYNVGLFVLFCIIGWYFANKRNFITKGITVR